MHARGDARQPFGAVIDGVEACHIRKQGLRRADVGGGLLAPDVLLAGLQRHAIRAIAVRVDGDTDDAAGRLPNVRLERREKRRVRSAISHRHAKPLRVAEHDVGAKLARRREQHEAQEIRRDRDEDACRPGADDEILEIVRAARFVRRLHERAEYAI